MLIGVLLGALAPGVGAQMKPLGDIFIRLIQMVVGLIIFCTVVHGIASARDFGKVGRVAIKALIYFEVVTSVALLIGLVAANVMQPGAGMHIDPASLNADAVASYAKSAKEGDSFGAFLTNLVPTSAVDAFARSDILQVLLFSVLFGCGLATLGEKADPVLRATEAVSGALFKVIAWVMKLAPLAAFGAMAFTVSKFGLKSLTGLGGLTLEFYATCILFMILVLWPVAALCGFSFLKMVRYFREELILVLGTSSSESVFPQLTAKLERLGIEQSVVGLVLPTSYSFNHTGTCLYFAAATVFLAQAVGVDLTWQRQVSLLLVMLFTSKGGAGVTGSALPVLALTLAATKLIPVESMALILGVHRLLSAAFVFVNIASNCVATIFVARWEKAVDMNRLNLELDAGSEVSTAYAAPSS
jgi:aerobic C4-dicarboxylate transport protein